MYLARLAVVRVFAIDDPTQCLAAPEDRLVQNSKTEEKLRFYVRVS
jgi:hypothetical protein